MQRTIIMDTSFLTWMDRFDGYCREHAAAFGLANYQMPMEILDYLLEQGCTLVIPNEVLKEVTHGRNGRVGMSISPQGEAYLNHTLLDHNPRAETGNRNVTDWLREKQLDHRVDCVAEGAGVWPYLRSDAAHGRVAIAAYERPTCNGGFEPHAHRDPNMIGDYEIENLFAAAPHHYDPHLLLSNDYELNDEVRKASPNVVNVSGSLFMEMAALTGFIHDFQHYPRILTQFGRATKNLAVDRPSVISHRRMRDTVTEWNLNRFITATGERSTRFATTLQERERMARRDGRG